MSRVPILFVDDDRYEMLGLVEALEAAGFDVRPAVDPDEAIRILEAGLAPRVVISDLIMRGGGMPLADRYVGVDFCRRLRQRGLTCPILAVTVVEDEEVLRDVRAHVTAVMRKPIAPATLVARVRSLL